MLGLGSIVLACSDDNPDGTNPTRAGSGGSAGMAAEAGGSGDASGGTSDSGGQPGAGQAGQASDAGAATEAGAGGDAGTAAGGQAGAGGEPRFPCDVQAAIEAKCQRCHTDPPLHGAPFPLLAWQHTRAPYGVQVVYEAMIPAIESDFMPFVALDLDPAVEPLTEDEKITLLEWLEGGAEPVSGNDECE